MWPLIHTAPLMRGCAELSTTSKRALSVQSRPCRTAQHVLSREGLRLGDETLELEAFLAVVELQLGDTTLVHLHDLGHPTLDALTSASGPHCLGDEDKTTARVLSVEDRLRRRESQHRIAQHDGTDLNLELHGHLLELCGTPHERRCRIVICGQRVWE